MKVVCAWCKKTIRDDENVKPDDPVSHGICVECKRKIEKEFESIKQYNEGVKNEKRNKKPTGIRR